MIRVLLTAHLLVILAMCSVILLQHSEGSHGPLGVISSNSLITSRQTGNLLTRITAFLAAAFMATSLVLSIVGGKNKTDSSILDGKEIQRKQDINNPLTIPFEIPNVLKEGKGQK